MSYSEVAMSEDKIKVPMYTKIGHLLEKEGQTFVNALSVEIKSGNVIFDKVEKDLVQRAPLEEVKKLKLELQSAPTPADVSNHIVSSTYQKASLSHPSMDNESNDSTPSNKIKPQPPHA